MRKRLKETISKIRNLAKPFKDYIRNNLKSLDKKFILIHFLLIPLIIISIYYLPANIKQTYFVLHTDKPTVLSMLLSHYTNELPFLVNNLAIYLISIFLIFMIDSDKKLFWYASLLIFLILPFLSSALTICMLEKAISSGSSAIVSAFLGYLTYAAFIFPIEAWKSKLSLSERLILGVGFFSICAIISFALIFPSDINFGEARIDVCAHLFGYAFGLIISMLGRLTKIKK